MISLVRVGGSKELSVGFGTGLEVIGVEVTSLDICDSGIEADTDMVGRVGGTPSPPIIGERVGGPIALEMAEMAGCTGMLEIGGLGDPACMCGEPGGPG